MLCSFVRVSPRHVERIDVLILTGLVYDSPARFCAIERYGDNHQICSKSHAYLRSIIRWKVVMPDSIKESRSGRS